MSALPEGLVARWRSRTVALDGGHLLWTGCGYVTWERVLFKPGRIAFIIRTGREPVGYVRADCDQRGCVTPEHVEDQPGRQRARQQLRAVRGMRPRPDVCRNGHDQTEHGRLEPDGRAYCHTCLNTTRTRGAA
jgi:hypothetical protein